MNKPIEKYIRIEFNYGNDLGKLQQQTEDNLRFIDELERWDDITSEEAVRALTAVYVFYITELEDMLNRAKLRAEDLLREDKQ